MYGQKVEIQLKKSTTAEGVGGAAAFFFLAGNTAACSSRGSGDPSAVCFNRVLARRRGGTERGGEGKASM